MVGFLPWLFLLFVEYLNHHSSDLFTLEERLFSHVHGIRMTIKCWPLPSIQFKRTSAVAHHCKYPASLFKCFWGDFYLCLSSHRGSTGVTYVATISGFMWILGIQSQILTPVWQAHYTQRVKLLPFFPFFFCHGIVRTHKNLNNGSLKDECKKFGVLG